MPLLQKLFPEQYVSADDDESRASEGYLKQDAIPTPLPYPLPGYAQTLPASYAEYPQTPGYAVIPSMSMPYASPIHQGQYTLEESPLTATSAASFTPVTPSSQGGFYPLNEPPSYLDEYQHTYDDEQVSVSQAYTDSATSVNPSDFFHQNRHLS